MLCWDKKIKDELILIAHHRRIVRSQHGFLLAGADRSIDRRLFQQSLDRVVLTDTQNVLVVSVGFRRRSVPLIWRILPHQGSSTLRDQQQLLRAAATLLPLSVRISVHADSEFRSQQLF